MGLKTNGLFGKWVTADARGAVYANSTSLGENEQWTVESKGNDKVALKGANGRYLVSKVSFPDILNVFPGDVDANPLLDEAGLFETFRVFKSGSLAIFQTFQKTAIYRKKNGALKHHGKVRLSDSIFEVRCLDW